MASFVLAALTDVPQTLAGSESGVITFTGGIITSSADAISTFTSNNGVVNNGHIHASGGFSAIDATGTGFELMNGPQGLITAYNPTSGTVDIDVSIGAQVFNQGTIFSDNSDALGVTPSDAGIFLELVNSGTIKANDAIAVNVNVGEGRAVIQNTGSLLGDTRAVVLSSSGSLQSQQMSNTGTIASLNGTALAFNLGTMNSLSLRNSGTISGEVEGIRADQNAPSVQILNSGLIEGVGPSFAVYLGDGLDRVVNTGTILGGILLGGAEDRYEGNAGTVSGTVDGGSGNDTLAGGDGAEDLFGNLGNDTLVGRGGDDSLRGGDGTDLLLGGAGNDEMDGGSEADTLNGNAGDDTLQGGSGNDLLVGQDGSDLLEGGDNNDTLDGGNGDDVLEGGNGNDILRGRNGEDDLAGGAGFDLLTGGQGADSFVFRALSETAVGATRDQILDFEQGVDLIIVAGLHPGVFEFRGTSAFAPSGNPELRLFETATGSSIVQMDADGNGTIDAEIRVANVTGLTAEDFVL